MYVAANYHHLQGFRFDEFNAKLQLDTDSNGLVSPDPPETPFTLEWHTSSKGCGLALDFGVAFVVNRWDFGAGVSGVANRIKWSDITRHELALVSLFNGTEFVHVKLPRTNLTTQFELPVTYTGDVSYHRDAWSAYTEYSHGLGGTNFRTGLEYRLGAVELRGCRPIFARQLVSVRRGRLQPDAQLWRRRGALRHQHLPRAARPCRAGHLPALRQR